MNQIDFIAIGDTVVDDFIRLTDAEVHCKVNHEDCELCVRFGDKVPFESSTLVYGVGNAANAAVSAARLGLKTAFVSATGKDMHGDKIVEHFKEERIDTSFVKQYPDVPTNYHYVLWYGDERTILVNQHHYPFTGMKDVPEAKTVYLSSLVDDSGAYHEEVADWLEAHPQTFFAFQPGVFEIKMGAEKLKRLYRRAGLFVVNKEEAERVLNVPETDDVESLCKGLHALGPETVIITDYVNGAYAYQNGVLTHKPMYKDPKPPISRTGAGDAFASTTSTYLTMGMKLEDAMTRGLVNAAYVVQQIGAQKGLLTKEALEKIVSGKN